MKVLVWSVATLALLSSCAGDEQRESIHTFSSLELCKAGIAVVYEGDPESMMMIGREHDDHVTFTWITTEDTWKFLCRIDRSRVLWAIETEYGWGRPTDGVVTYAIGEGGHLEVTATYSDGSSKTNSFSAAQLGS